MANTPNVVSRQPSFDLQLQVTWGTLSCLDFTASFDADAKVADLLAAVELHVKQLESQPSFDLEQLPDGAGVYIVTRHRFGEEPEAGAFLPREALLSSCNLTNGMRVEIRRAVDDDPPELPVDLESELAELFLTDVISPSKGRVTAIRPTRRIAVGSRVDVNGPDWPVVVDDVRVPDTAFWVTVEGNTAYVDPVGNVPLLVNGRRVRSRVKAHPGSTIDLPVFPAGAEKETPPVRHVIFAVTTAEGIEARSPFGRVRFEPSARRPDETYPRLEVDSLPSRPEPPEPPALKWPPLVIPLVLGVLMSVVMSPFFLLFALAQPIIYLLGYRDDKKKNEERYASGLSKWEYQKNQILDEFAGLVETERGIRLRTTSPVETWLTRALRRLPGLWERQPGHRDFLEVRLGTGTIISGYFSQFHYRAASQDKAEQERIDERVQRAALLTDVPVTVKLSDRNIALVGSEDHTAALAASIVLQLACQHSPGDLAIAALLPRSAELYAPYDFLKWLPHFQTASTLLPVEHCALGRKATTQFLDAVIDRLTERREYRKEERSSHAMLLVHEAAEVDQTLLAEVCRLSEGLVHFVWLGSGKAGRPSIVDTTFEIRNDLTTDVESRGDYYEWAENDFQAETLSVQRAHFVAQALSPLYDPRAVGSSRAIPSVCPLASVVQLDDSPPSFDVTDSLRVPLGVDEDGIFYLDLVSNGPHILIGGTTGSGKSELLQSLVASLCATYHPNAVSLLLVDFKGGATFRTFKDLPHTVGFVSDLDEGNVSRVLDFLDAELKRRLRLFDSTTRPEGQTVKDYIEFRGCSDEPLPRLVTVFDEFATLTAGDRGAKVMPRIVDVAQRGRSLGVHLVLATQQPSAQVVSAQVKANLGAKIALRTIDAGNSEIIVDAPDAALIPRALPGRAVVRLEGTQLIQFQAAYAGSKQEHARRTSRTTSVRLQPFDLVLTS